MSAANLVATTLQNDTEDHDHDRQSLIPVWMTDIEDAVEALTINDAIEVEVVALTVEIMAEDLVIATIAKHIRQTATPVIMGTNVLVIPTKPHLRNVWTDTKTFLVNPTTINPAGNEKRNEDEA